MYVPSESNKHSRYRSTDMVTIGTFVYLNLAASDVDHLFMLYSAQLGHDQAHIARDTHVR